MPDPELIQTLDYILNRSNEASLDAVAAAVERRQKDFRVNGAISGMPDPQRMAKEISGKINSSINASIGGLKESVREMVVGLIKEKAPDLTDEQVEVLSRTWISPVKSKESKVSLPRDMLISMIEQFVSFSMGTMDKSIENNLRQELGAWPERYWKAFPPVIRSIVSDYLKDKITEREFYSKIGIALEL